MLNGKIAMTTVAALAASLSFAAPAMAQVAQTMQVQVDISDLDISSAKGQLDAQRRIRSAVAAVCPLSHERDLYLQNVAKQCRSQALSDAMQQMRQRSQVAGVASGPDENSFLRK